MGRIRLKIIIETYYRETSLSFFVKVIASFSRVEAEPGTSVSFDVETTPGAFVGVLAIDKSVLLLADGNDITHNQVSSRNLFLKFFVGILCRNPLNKSCVEILCRNPLKESFVGILSIILSKNTLKDSCVRILDRNHL